MKRIILLICVACLFLFCGCKEEQPITDANGTEGVSGSVAVFNAKLSDLYGTWKVQPIEGFSPGGAEIEFKRNGVAKFGNNDGEYTYSAGTFNIHWTRTGRDETYTVHKIDGELVLHHAEGTTIWVLKRID